MNNLEDYFQKSDHRIAQENTDSISQNIINERINNRSNFINNFNNNLNNNHNISPSSIVRTPTNLLTTPAAPIHRINNRFASIPSSPSLEDSTHTVSLATLNVRGFNNTVKFDAFLDDFISSSISIIGLQETRISDRSATPWFKEYWARRTKQMDYVAKWDFNPADSHSGVALIIQANIAKYIQKVHKHYGRFLAVDLYLPSRKLKIINVYCYPSCYLITREESNGKRFNKFVMKHIKDAETAGFTCIILGDFNADPYFYHDALAKGNSIPSHLSLVEFLYEKNYIDQHPIYNNDITFATFYQNSLPCSRIDQIWYPASLIDELCFDRVWSLPSSEITADPSFSTDHKSVIVYFTRILLISDLPAHRRKQKQEWRQIFDLKKIFP